MPQKRMLMDPLITGQVESPKSVQDVLEVNPKTGNYSFVLSDRGKIIEVNSASLVTLTVPPESQVNFPIGTVINVCRVGTGSVLISGGFGMLNSSIITAGGQGIYLRVQWSEGTIRKRAADSWVVSGDLLAQ